MYEVLAHLFQTCQQAECADGEQLIAELQDAGFANGDISAALRWMGGVACPVQRSIRAVPGPRRAVRVFAQREIAKLDEESRGFLLTLEQAGILTPHTRELVLERCLAAQGAALSLDEVKLIVLIVLWTRHAELRPLLAPDVFSATGACLPN